MDISEQLTTNLTRVVAKLHDARLGTIQHEVARDALAAVSAQIQLEQFKLLEKIANGLR